MNPASVVTESLITVMQISCIYYLYLEYGIILALVASISAIIAYSYFIKSYLKLIPLKPSDKILLGFHFFERQTILIKFELENLDLENMQKIFIERAFRKVDKLSSRLVYKFFDFYWEKSPLTEAQILKKRLLVHPSKTKEEVDQFVHESVHNDLNIYDTPVEIHLIPQTEDSSKGYLFIRSDHCFTDGLGILSLLACISDGYSPDIFPQIMHKRTGGIISELIDLTLFILFGMFILVYLVITTKTSVKFNKKPRSKDTVVISSAVIDLEPLKRKSKELKISINEILIPTMLASIKSLYPEEKRITLMIPFALTPVPKNSDEIKLANYVLAIIKDVNLINHPTNEFKIFQSDYKKLMSQAKLIKITNWGIHIMSMILPFKIFKTLSLGVTKEVDFSCSSVPTTIEPLRYGKTKSVTAAGISSTGYISFCYTMVSHAGKLTLTGMVDKSFELDSQKLTKNFEKTLNEIISS